MKKIVCPNCQLVNLDKFVSFPHCAACGARLPQQQPAPWRAFWRRPVGTIYWALTVGLGLGLLAWGVVSIARETRERGDKPLLVYAQLPRAATPGQAVVANFTLDSAEENPDDILSEVQLRLARETLRDFAVMGLQPAPQTTTTRGSGHYYLWQQLPRGTTVRLSLRARVTGAEIWQLHAALGARNYQFFEIRSTLRPPDAATGQKPPSVAR